MKFLQCVRHPETFAESARTEAALLGLKLEGEVGTGTFLIGPEGAEATTCVRQMEIRVTRREV